VKDRPIFIEKVIDALARGSARVCEKVWLPREIMRRLRFKGKYRIKTYIRPACLPSDVIASCRGVRYRLDLTDDLQRQIYFNLHEEYELETISKLIPRGGLCVDVGANVGFYTLHFARCVGKNGTVHAFEPDPLNFVKLHENVKLNDFEAQIILHDCAITNKTGTATFYQSKRSHSGWGSLVEFKDIAVAQVDVHATTLDDFLASKGIGNVDLLKVDVEAGEFELLEGAARSLRNHIFRYIFIEYFGARLAEHGKTFADFWDIFHSYGYKAIELNLDLLRQMSNGIVPAEKQLVNWVFESEKV